MEEIKNNIKIAYAKNLNKQTFSSTISMAIDNNVNIKTILDITSYVFDEKVECGNGKAIINGKLGVKVLYIDTDNLTNTLSSSQSFSETFADSTITNDCFINIANYSISNTTLSKEGVLKINCETTFSPIVYLNLGMDNKSNSFENMIVKKSEMQTSTIANIVKTNFEHTINFETKDVVSKILAYNAHFVATNSTANDGVAVVEGKIYSYLVFETNSSDETKIKEIKDVFNVKTEIPIENMSNGNRLDLSFNIDPSRENIATDFEDDNSIITIKHSIKVCGVEIKNIVVDIVDDMYSTENEIEISLSNREFVKDIQEHSITENISNEIVLADNEPAVEQIISNLNIIAEITNSYIKENLLFFEGVISSHMVYLDENKEYQTKLIEMPFIINSKISMTDITCSHASISIMDCKAKTRRGTIIELEYILCVKVCVFEKDSKEMVNNISLGKSLDFGAYDYQIFLAKPNESAWDLCKRIKIAPDDLSKYNPHLPLVMEGGEKVIIKR